MEGPSVTGRFEGQVAVVTGAGGGIGAAAGLRLAAEGAHVALMDLRAPALEPVRAAIERAGFRALTLEVNQTDRDQVEAGIAQVQSELGPITCLFANAGYGQFATFLETSIKNWARHIDVNLHGTFHMCQTVARAMVENKKGGSIVINTSSAATVECDHLTSYGASKAGARMLAMGMAAELGMHRIRVNAVLPGVIETPMTLGMLEDSRHRDVLEAETPVGRLGLPEDIANLVAFLLSDEAAFITGASVPIDGGQTLHGHPRWFRADYRKAFEEEWSIPT